MRTSRTIEDEPPRPDWVNFQLGEDVRNERRLEQDKMWAEAVADGRVNLSHREVALEYREQFLRAIEHFSVIETLLESTCCRSSAFYGLDDGLVHLIVEFALPGQGPLVPALMYQREMVRYLDDLFCSKAGEDEALFRVCLRKRPLLAFEVSQGCYDVARIMNKHEVILHDGRLARNGRLLSMTHHRFVFDRVFSEEDGNDLVCEETVRPLLNWATEGKQATLLCFGQTGTGKTHTLYGALRFLAEALAGRTVRLIFYEVHGSKCYDLLQNRRQIFLRMDDQGELHVRGAREAQFSLEVLDEALKLRSSLQTERNPISSRSHAVCILDLGPGRLTLVDLAGSERNYETVLMTAAQHKESAEINLALMALKECFRAHYFNRQKGSIRIPYRSSTLTKVLKTCFQPDRPHFTTIIATISPSPIDLQHSVNTTSHVSLMSPRLPTPLPLATVEVPKRTSSAPSSLPMDQWTNEQVQAWIATVDRGRFAHLVLPPGINGVDLLQLSAANFAELFETQEQAGRQEREGPTWVISAEETGRLRSIGHALFMAIRREEYLHHQ
eukprot:gene2597-2840_t